MLFVRNPKKTAEQIRNGTLRKRTIVVKLDEPVSSGCLPVIWITDVEGKRQFGLKQSHACVNRGAGKGGETWRVMINRFGEFFLEEKVPNIIEQSVDVPETKGYRTVGVTLRDGKHTLRWLPHEELA